MSALTVVVTNFASGTRLKVIVVPMFTDIIVKWNGACALLCVKHSGRRTPRTMKVGRFSVQMISVWVARAALRVLNVLCRNRAVITGMVTMVTVKVVGRARNSLNLAVWSQVDRLLALLLVCRWCDSLGSSIIVIVVFMMFSGSRHSWLEQSS